MTAIGPTQSNVQQALRDFLLAILPPTGSDGQPIAIVAGLQNRVPEPAPSNWVVFAPIRIERLATNIDGLTTATFTGSIVGNVLTVTSIASGEVLLGAIVNSGTGTYLVSPYVYASGTLTASAKTLTQQARVVVQIDFHATDGTGSDMAQTVSTALRDEYGTTFFSGLPPPFNAVSPLYADDPRMTPFVNDQNQYEWRWTLEAHLQVDQAVVVPQLYATGGTVIVNDVDALYPPH